ncbi:MAG: hypothetical protein IJ104_09850 [Methanobrevibacter sp.]|nr:hypothetical protein [Methanobrevibacter sp.]
MENKIELNISKDSTVIFASDFGVGANNEEIRLIVVNNKLISDESSYKLVSESDLQIVMNHSTALKLRNLLNEYI